MGCCSSASIVKTTPAEETFNIALNKRMDKINEHIRDAAEKGEDHIKLKFSPGFIPHVMKLLRDQDYIVTETMEREKLSDGKPDTFKDVPWITVTWHTIPNEKNENKNQIIF